MKPKNLKVCLKNPSWAMISFAIFLPLLTLLGISFFAILSSFSMPFLVLPPMPPCQSQMPWPVFPVIVFLREIPSSSEIFINFGKMCICETLLWFILWLLFVGGHHETACKFLNNRNCTVHLSIFCTLHL